MAVSENTRSLPVARRLLLGGAAMTALARPAAADAADPDADLIRLCAEHVVNIRAYNDGPARLVGVLDLEDHPLWLAYEHTRDAISAARPQSVAGMLAKIRAAKAEAQTPKGDENPAGTMAAEWAWDLVNDLLRLHGRG